MDPIDGIIYYKHKFDLKYSISTDPKCKINVPLNAILIFEVDAKTSDNKQNIKGVGIPIGALPSTKVIDELIKNSVNSHKIECYRIHIGTTYNDNDLCYFARYVLGSLHEELKEKSLVVKEILDSLGINQESYSPEKYLTKINDDREKNMRKLIGKKLENSDDISLRIFKTGQYVVLRFTKAEMNGIHQYGINADYLAKYVQSEISKKYELLKSGGIRHNNESRTYYLHFGCSEKLYNITGCLSFISPPYNIIRPLKDFKRDVYFLTKKKNENDET